IEYARVCVPTRRYQAAASLYASAFAADPKLAEHRRPDYRYDGACYAALAAAGKGSDGAHLNNRERIYWRRQALTWLRADLALRIRQLESGKPADRAAVQEHLRHWQRDPDLVSLRDPEALTRLSAEERQACQKLWADVAAVLRTASS